MEFDLKVLCLKILCTCFYCHIKVAVPNFDKKEKRSVQLLLAHLIKTTQKQPVFLPDHQLVRMLFSLLYVLSVHIVHVALS